MIILVAMAIPAARTLIKIEDTRNSELTVKVTGYQWKWQYEYLDQGVSFFSTLARTSDEARQLDSGIDPRASPNYLLEVDNPLVVPVGTQGPRAAHRQRRDPRLVGAGLRHEEGRDPRLHQRDVVQRADKPGTYRGQCAELCGRDHGFMPVVVEVKPQAEFDAWLAAQKAARQAAAAPAAQTAALAAHG